MCSIPIEQISSDLRNRRTALKYAVNTDVEEEVIKLGGYAIERAFIDYFDKDAHTLFKVASLCAKIDFKRDVKRFTLLLPDHSVHAKD